MITSIYQEVELSLTENLIPVTVPVKQYDNRVRKVRCVLYNNSVQYSVPQDCIVACSGTRPDGTIFHYTSETASDLVFVESGAVVFTITTFMTAQAGRFPLDVVMLSTAGDVLGSFSLTLVFVVCDYFTGVLAAAIKHELSSEVGFKGIAKKVCIFVLVGIANIIDTQILQNGAAIRTAVVFFYLANEGLSCLENAAVIGLPVPEKLKEMLAQLKEERVNKDE